MATRQGEYGEKHWFGYGGWRVLYRDIMRLAAIEVPVLIDGLSSTEPDLSREVRAFLDRLGRAMAERQNSSSKWSYGISLLGDFEELVTMIKGDPILNGSPDGRSTAPEAAFWIIFPRFLNRARQRQGGTSPHRVAMWERMDRESRQIASSHERAGRRIDRMSIEHILEVKARCLEKWPTDKNVNVDLPTFRGYFEEFCDDAREVFDPDAANMSTDRYQSLVHDTGVKPAARVCLDRLSRHDQTLWDAFLVKLDMHPRIALTLAPYAQSVGVSRYEMEQRYSAAAIMMKKCVEASLDLLLRR